MCSSTPKSSLRQGVQAPLAGPWPRSRSQSRRCARRRRMTGQRRDRGVVIAERIGGPSDRSHRQHCPRRRDRMLLGERRRGTTRLEAPPNSAQPAHHRHPAQAGRVVQHSAAAAMSDREHPRTPDSRAQANQTRPSTPAAADHRLELRSRACLERRTSHRPGRTSAYPGHTYSGSPSGPSSDCLVASDPEGPGTLTP
jgi:hypothetical protein